MSKSKSKAFLIYHDNKTFIDKLSDEQAGQLFKAIFDYEVDGIEPEEGRMSDVLDMCFEMFKLNLDRARADYEKKCKARAEAGRKGGLAKASNAKQNLANLGNKNIKIKKSNWRGIDV